MQVEKVSSDNFRPIHSIKQKKLALTAYDSLYGAPKVLLTNNDSIFWHGSEWNVLRNSQVIDSGLMLQDINLELFKDSSTFLSLVQLNAMTGKDYPVYLSRYQDPNMPVIVRILFPLHFLNYSSLTYSDEICDLSRFKLKRINKTLYIFNEKKKWEPLNTFNGFKESF